MKYLSIIIGALLAIGWLHSPAVADMGAICAEMKANCVLVETPWFGIIPALEGASLM